MEQTLALDVYGTLIDPMGFVEDLRGRIGDDGAQFAALWREKQIEYLFRRGLGRKYEPFSVCTRQALDYTRVVTKAKLREADCAALMARYLDLPAYPGTADALAVLKRAGFSIYAFSNGEPDDLATLMDNAGLSDSLDGIISVHEVRSYKPDPSVYAFFLENTGATLGNTWLVSANGFDVIGALQVGWKAVWVQRDLELQFDPWGIEPTAIVPELGELLAVLT